MNSSPSTPGPDWEWVREQLPAVKHQVYLNTGTCGPLPRAAVDAMSDVITGELERGRIEPGRFYRVDQMLKGARAQIARIIGARDDQIVLTNRTTDGLNIVLWGMRWQPGDEILTTTHEHAGLLVPLAALRQRYGVEIRYLPLEDFSPSAIINRFQAAMSHRTRLLALSHVLWTNGAVMPLTELVRIAHDAGARVLIDGAQSAGAIPVDVAASAVDFYALPGQKWLCGPEGTGALYISDDALATVDPVYSGYVTATAYDHKSPTFMAQPGAARFEVGIPFPPAVSGLKASVEWLLDEVGLQPAMERINRLAGRLRQRLRDVPQVEVLTPEPVPGATGSGLVSFNIAGHDPVTVAKDLARRGFVGRHLPEQYPAVRMSVGFYNTEEELDALVENIASIAEKPGS